MAWGLSSWLGLVRCVQTLATLSSAASQAFLVAYISINALGPAQNVMVLSGMTTASFIFVVLAYAIIHTGDRSRNTQWLVAGIVGDLIFTGIALAAITMLAQAGVPQHCAGLTRWNYLPGDETRPPKEGYTSIRFTNAWGGAKGELDRYCAAERAVYVVFMALVFCNMLSITLSILRICEGNYTKNSRVELQILNTMREEEKLKSIASSPSPRSEPQTPPLASPMGSSSAYHNHPQTHNAYQQHYPNSSNIRATSPQLMSELSARVSVQQLPPLPHLGSSSSTSSGSVSGMSPRPQISIRPPQQQQILSPLSTYYSVGSTTAVASSSASLIAPHQSHPTVMSNFGGYEASPEEAAAAAALITDGSSHGSHHVAGGGGTIPALAGLPPYTPGRHPMGGHGNESNEIRLSEYVKGETRAQNMKDGGFQ